MATLAIATVVITIFAIPGYIARLCYFSGELTSAILPKRIFGDLITALILSFPLHGIVIFLSEVAHHTGTTIGSPIVPPDIDFIKVFRVFSGNFEKDGMYSLNQIILNSYRNVLWGALYGLLVICIAILFGWKLRRSVWDQKLDLKYPAIFQFENLWLYWLRGRLVKRDESRDHPESKIVTTIDALIEHEDTTKLYRGVWFDFTTNQTGDLENIFVTSARRWSRTRGQWVDIPGNILVLKYSTAKNINISYYLFNPEAKELQFLEGVELDR